MKIIYVRRNDGLEGFIELDKFIEDFDASRRFVGWMLDAWGRH